MDNFLSESCKTGNYFDKSTLACRPCDMGYYQDETGKMSCKSCGNGQTTQQTESTSEVDCLSKYNWETTQHTRSTS